MKTLNVLAIALQDIYGGDICYNDYLDTMGESKHTQKTRCLSIRTCDTLIVGTVFLK